MTGAEAKAKALEIVREYRDGGCDTHTECWRVAYNRIKREIDVGEEDETVECGLCRGQIHYKAYGATSHRTTGACISVLAERVRRLEER